MKWGVSRPLYFSSCMLLCHKKAYAQELSIGICTVYFPRNLGLYGHASKIYHRESEHVKLE